VVLDLARKIGLQVLKGFFAAAEIFRADEMFLTSSTREVVPIARMNGTSIGGGKPGPVTLMLLKAYRSALENLIAED
jgi:branched-subunit amino acid aminotransferase/4-amino-4-deoxychorismate lyase